MPSKKLSSILIIIGSVINIVGGIFLIWCRTFILPSMHLLAYTAGFIFELTLYFLPIIVMAGAIVGFFYPKAGNITCLILGLFLLLSIANVAISMPIENLGILLPIISLPIIGSIIGLIGVSRRKKMDGHHVWYPWWMDGQPKRKYNNVNLSSDL
jgi:hypothetical protein